MTVWCVFVKEKGQTCPYFHLLRLYHRYGEAAAYLNGLPAIRDTSKREEGTEGEGPTYTVRHKIVEGRL